jgi:hypothetical protein
MQRRERLHNEKDKSRRMALARRRRLLHFRRSLPHKADVPKKTPHADMRVGG